MSIFEYAFMQRAFIVGILLGMTIPCIGTIIVLKRLSMLGDTLSHTSLAGVAGGLVFHINLSLIHIFHIHGSNMVISCGRNSVLYFSCLLYTSQRYMKNLYHKVGKEKKNETIF